MCIGLVMVALAAATGSASAGAPPARAPETVFVLDVELGVAMQDVDRTALLEGLLDSMRDPAAWKLVPQRDVSLFLDNERSARILGKSNECSTERCISELAGALGGFVLRTHVGKIADKVQVVVRVSSASAGVVATGKASGPASDLEDVAQRAGLACLEQWRRSRNLVPAPRRPVDASVEARPQPAAPPRAPPPPARAVPGLERPMVRLEGGAFRIPRENRSVKVDPFLLDVTEVSAAAYLACVEARRCSAPDGGEGCTSAARGKGSHPANCVGWRDAVAYCKFEGKRLPSGDEWEWAAHGAERGTRYPWGDEPPGGRVCAPVGEEGRPGWTPTCPVGGHPAGDSPQGVKDLGGNVSEWTSTRVDAPGSLQNFAGMDSWEEGVPREVVGSGILSQERNPRLGFRCAKTP